MSDYAAKYVFGVPKIYVTYEVFFIRESHIRVGGESYQILQCLSNYYTHFVDLL